MTLSDPAGLYCCVSYGPTIVFTGDDKNDRENKVGIEFKIIVAFKKDGTATKKGKCCNVDDCKFKQLVKGYWLKNGKERAFTAGKSGGSQTVQTNAFVDDIVVEDMTDRMIDCDDTRYRFETYDEPGIAHPDETAEYEYYLFFKAQVIDKPSGEVVAEKNGYWIKIVGQYPRKLTHS